MKNIFVLASFILGITAVPTRRSPAVNQANISGFSASTKEGGNGASISYDIDIPGVVSTHCEYSDSTSEEKLPAVSLTACDDVAVKWQFRQDPSQPGSEGRYRIVVVYTGSNTGAAGYHEWSPEDFPLDNEGEETVYKGAPDFTIAMDE